MKGKRSGIQRLINESNNNNCCCNFFTYIKIQKFYTQKKKNHFKSAVRNSLWKEKDLEFKD